MIKVGSRNSALSIQQTQEFIKLLKKPAFIVPVQTSGDQISTCLKKAGGKGLFSKELHENLLSNEIDVAIHSLKDLETKLPDGIDIACIFAQQAREDVLLFNPSIKKFPIDGIIGTCSPRREGLLKYYFPKLRFESYRGNVERRIQKLLNGEVDATVLALAGLIRLGLWHDHRLVFKGQKIKTKILPLHHFPCAVGQGFLAATCRVRDIPLFRHMNLKTKIPFLERRLLQSIEGDCHTGLGVYFKSNFFKVCYQESSQMPLVWKTSSNLSLVTRFLRSLKHSH